jgi:hypothetical protein
MSVVGTCGAISSPSQNTNVQVQHAGGGASVGYYLEMSFLGELEDAFLP